MSKNPAAIIGDFATYRPVLGRKVLALVIEVPIERAPEVFAALGYPTGGDSIPVAVARLEATASQTESVPEEAPEEPPPPARLRHWAEMTPAQQTGVIRNERQFWEFAEADDSDAARDYIRDFCGVKTCADIVPGTKAAAEWALLQVRYGNWLRRRRGAA